MGARGPGARRKIDAVKQAPAKRRKPSWQYAGLSRFERVLRFVQSLPVTKGPLAGRRIKLLPGQVEFLRATYDRPDSEPVNLAILSEPRGNGKTGLLQGLSLCHLMGPEAQPRGEVYAAAVDRVQSGKMFNEIEATLLATPELAARVNIQRFAKRVEVLSGPGTGSVFEAMSGDARKGHGLAPSFWCYDELARVDDRELLDALLTGMGKRRCLGVIISTQAPDDEHPLSTLIDDALTGVDKSAVCRVTAAPMNADWRDPDVLRSVNPALGSFLDEKTLLDEQQKAQRIPAFEANFRNLRLNQRIDARADDRLVTASVWKENAGSVDRKALAGHAAFGGLDLASKHDLTAFVLVFPNENKPAGYDILPWFWTPAGQMAKRAPAEQERFREWIAGGYITEVPGDVVTTAVIASDLVAICEEFDVKTINFDKWHIDYLKRDLEEIGVELPLENFGQGHSRVMAPAVEFLAECALTARLRHAGNPVLTASVAGAIVTRDKAGNPMLDKPKSNKRGPVRIDGAVALTMALGAAKGWEPSPKKPSLDGFLKSPVMVV